eukprot:gene12220-16370_t
MDRWVVHKFGGTSVGNPSCMRQCLEIIRPLTSTQRIAVVVSAMGGKPKVTDLLLDLVHAAAADRTDEIHDKISQIEKKHLACVQDVLNKSPSIAEKIMNTISKDLKDISDLLRAVQLMRMAHEQILELVSGYGEIWSANIMAELMKQEGLPFVFLNARDVLIVSEHENLGTTIHWEISEEKLGKYIAKAELEFDSSKYQNLPNGIKVPHLMITGYIATSVDGVATTLKRDGSDFSASIFGKMLRATAITIWTDVSGVFSADPRRVPEAQVISEVSYTEAIELAYFGAKVIHPKTMAPAIIDKIPIYIRNTFEPSHSGTRIYLAPTSTSSTIRERAVCGFTTVDSISLLNLEGTGMIGVPGIAHRLFGALKTANISVMFIAQASSEHSICFATKQIYAEKAKEAIEKNFFYELQNGMISAIRVINDCSIIAAVGESMSNMPGVSGLFFGALGSASINVLSISQGCDERNISAVVYSKEATRALRVVHAAFWLSATEISVGIVGTGRVGSSVIQALLDQSKILDQRFGICLKIRGVANSRKMLLGEDVGNELKQKNFFVTKNSSITKSNSQTLLNESMANDENEKSNVDLSSFLSYLKSGGTPHTIIIDASTSLDVAKLHPTWLKSGAHVVTANKRGISNSLDLYHAIMTVTRSSKQMYMSEVTIGASLPIQTTLNDILCSGDAVHGIIGLMSVSSGMILTDICDNGLSFTQALVKTYNQGLFEDDVFVDLDGTEAAEKLLILVRELGFPMSISDIEIEPLAKRREVGSWANPGAAFAAEDKSFADRAKAAAAKGCTLRYVQRVECSPAAELGNQKLLSMVKATVRLEEVPLDSNHALVKGAVYYFSFHTARYSQNPLIVQGPLSDSANTASGVIGDILRIARSFGAKDRGPDISEK